VCIQVVVIADVVEAFTMPDQVDGLQPPWTNRTGSKATKQLQPDVDDVDALL
jgi:hypothetical protein